MREQMIPRMRPQDTRNLIRNETIQQVAQDPMQQIMQMLQIQGQQQQMQQQQEESPLQMALMQLQIEAMQGQQVQGQQMMQQNQAMHPEELLRIQLMNQAAQRDLEMQQIQAEAMRAAGGGAVQGAQGFNPANF